jgi:hypothetical protein
LSEFWSFGHDLFRSTPLTFPATFIPGDVFDPQFLEPGPIVYEKPSTPLPDVTKFASLTPFRGRLSAIYAGAFFHLFSEEQQLGLAHRIGSLLSPEPGSMIFGWQAILEENSNQKEIRGMLVFFHTPESWTEMWDGQVFKKGSVKFEVVSEHVPELDEGFSTMSWCVTRL